MGCEHSLCCRIMDGPLFCIVTNVRCTITLTPLFSLTFTTRTQLSSIISLSHLILSMKGIGGRGVQCGRSLSHCCCWSWYACFACTTTLMAGECRSLFCLDGFNSAWQNHNPSFFFRNPLLLFRLPTSPSPPTLLSERQVHPTLIGERQSALHVLCLALQRCT